MVVVDNATFENVETAIAIELFEFWIECDLDALDTIGREGCNSGLNELPTEATALHARVHDQIDKKRIAHSIADDIDKGEKLRTVTHGEVGV